MKRIIICSYPRSGLHLLSWSLAYAIDCPVHYWWLHEDDHKQSEYLVEGAHNFDERPDCHRFIYLERNPRDIAVSFTHFWDEYQTITDSIKAINTGWKDHQKNYKHWADMVVSFEEYRAKPLSILCDVCELVTGKRMFNKCKESVIFHTIENCKQRTIKLYGKDSQEARIVRSGKSGAWIDEFTPEDEELARKYFD